MAAPTKWNRNSGLEGIQFQINLLTLCFLNYLRCPSEWKISTKNMMAGNCVVAELLDERTTLIKTIYKRNKHVTKKQLVSHYKDADFSLAKYFFFYEEVKSKFKENTVIICTNAYLNTEGLEHIIISQTIDPENILFYEGDKSIYKFNENILPELKENAEIYFNNNLQGKGICKTVVTDENLKVFLNNLQFFSNCPCENKLFKIFDQLLSHLNYSQLYSKVSPGEIYRKVEEWCQQSYGEYLTKFRAMAMFSEIKSDKYCESLKNYSVSFKYNDFIFTDTQNKRVFHVITENGLFLQILKIFAVLQTDNGKKLFVSPKEDVEVQTSIIKAFELPSYTYLIMTCSKITDKAVQNEVCTKLRQILLTYPYKKVILVAEGKNKLVQQIALKDTIQFDGYITFENFSMESQVMLLNSKIVDFQSKTISLKELLLADTQMLQEVLTDLELLNKILRRKEIKVGEPPLGFDKDVAPCYIPRLFRRIVNKQKEEKRFFDDEIFNINEKVILIEGCAGMGKSTILTKLATTIKEERPDLWVIKIDLNDYTRILSSQMNNGETLSIIELLNSLEHTKFKNYLEKGIFSMKGRVVLMLDEMEKISEDYMGVILELISHCEHAPNFIKIFVTAQLQLSEKLEAHLGIRSFKILPFTKQNQIKFLALRWVYELKISDDTNKDRCKNYAETLITKMFSRTELHHCKENHISPIPLQMKMLAEIFLKNDNWKGSADWMGCQQYLYGKGKVPKLPEIRDITMLYKMFIEKKRNDFINKVDPTENKEFEKYLEFHRILALEEILGKRSSNLFLNYRRIELEEKYILMMNIIQKSNGRFNFRHKTIGEYLVAESILKEFQLPNENIEFQRFLIDKILSNYEFTVIRTFLDGFLKEVGDSLPSNIFETYATCNASGTCENLIQLAKEGLLANFQFILKFMNFQSVTDDLYCMTTYLGNSPVIKANTLQRFTQKKYIDLRDETRRMHYAAQNWDLDMVTFLDTQHADVNKTDVDGYTAQNLTVSKIYLDIPKLFMDVGYKHSTTTLNVPLNSLKQKLNLISGINKDTQLNVQGVVYFKFFEELTSVNNSENENHATLYLAMNSDLKIIKHILKEAGIDVNTKNNKGFTWFHLANFYKNWDIASFFVEGTVIILNKHGINVKVIDITDRILLYLDSKSEALDIVQFSGKYGVNPYIRDVEGCTSQDLAQRNYISYMEYREKFHVKGQVTEKHSVVYTGDIHDTAILPIERAVNIADVGKKPQSTMGVSNKDSGNFITLHLAASQGQLELIESLIDDGEDVNAKDDNDNTPLHLADDEGDLDIVKFLVGKGANINITDGDGNTVLHCAAECDRLDSVQYFVQETGANVNAKDNGGRTPLHLAAKWGNVDIVEFLLKSEDIDVNMQDNDGRTPLHSAAEWHTLDTVKLLTEKNIIVNIKDSDGNTALHLAVRWGNLSTMLYLAEREKTKINTTNNYGHTVLHLVAEEGELDVVKTLVNYGANVKIKDKQGYTALDLAEFKSHMNIVEYLKNSKTLAYSRSEAFAESPLKMLTTKSGETFGSMESYQSQKLQRNVSKEHRYLRTGSKRNNRNTNIRSRYQHMGDPRGSNNGSAPTEPSLRGRLPSGVVE